MYREKYLIISATELTPRPVHSCWEPRQNIVCTRQYFFSFLRSDAMDSTPEWRFKPRIADRRPEWLDSVKSILYP